MIKNKNEYALYDDDTLLDFGTLDYLAERLNIKKDTLFYYLTPSYQKRAMRNKKKRILIKIELEEEDYVS